MSKNETLPRLLTHEQMAELFNVSKVTVRRLRYEGELATVRIRGQARIPRESGEAYLSPAHRELKGFLSPRDPAFARIYASCVFGTWCGRLDCAPAH